MAAARKSVSLLRRIVSSRYHFYEQRATLYTKYKGLTYSEWLVRIRNTDYNVTTADISRMFKQKEQKDIRTDQQFDSNLRARVGVELSVAHFIVNQGGAVRFVGSDRWIELEQTFSLWGNKHNNNPLLPDKNQPGYNVEAVDATGLNIMYDSFDMLEDLRYIKYLNISDCKYVDDWCFERIMPISDTLVVLDMSGCPLVTERGLATVHKFPSLRRLICRDMSGVKNPALVKLLLEEMLPNCVVDGLADYTDPEELEKSEPIAEPVLCVPPRSLVEEVTNADWIFLDVLMEDEKKEKMEEQQKLIASGSASQSEDRGDAKMLPEPEAVANEKR